MDGPLAIDELVALCLDAAQGPQPEAMVAEELSRVVGRTAHLLDGLSVCEGGVAWYQSEALTIAVLATPPGFRFWPHNHEMWAVTAMLSGTEDNETLHA